ncbi:MAG: transglycosylase domain-containing protein [Candidatus Sericytochromatia bacterium]
MSTANPAPLAEDSRTRQILWFIFVFVLKLLTALLVVLLACGGGLAVGGYLRLQSLPDVTKLGNYDPAERSEIVSRDGQVLKQVFGEENRKIVLLKDLPTHVPDAVLAIEDARFREHTGVDPIGILRAVKANMDSNETVQGGSTITQQVVKNLFLTSERSYARKAAEAVLSVQVDQTYNKEQILELYLNLIYLGHNAYGVEAAAETYFGKSAKQLTLAEAAMVAGLIRGPEIFSPYRNYALAKKRQGMVLDKMVQYQFIKPEAAAEAKKAPLKLPGIRRGMLYPYFTTYAMSYLKERYSETDLETKGLRIVTSIDTRAQNAAQATVNKHLDLLKRMNVQQGALVSLDATTGHVVAMVGGTKFGYGANEFNRAYQAQRQTGSSFKPFVYVAGFENGYSPYSIEVDGPTTYRMGTESWSPQNYGRSFSGAISIRQAIMRSINVVAVKVMDKVGIGKVVEMTKRLGIKSEVRPYLSSALGASEITPLEMAQAYGAFANDGMYTEASPILWIEDKNGQIIYDNRKPKPKKVLDQDVVRALNYSLLATVNAGTGTAARIANHQIAGKTGTTSSHRDAWFMGYTPHYVTAVWVGNDTPTRMYGATGGGFCAPIWRDFMVELLKNEKPRPFPKELPLRRRSSLTKGTAFASRDVTKDKDKESDAEERRKERQLLARQVRDEAAAVTPTAEEPAAPAAIPVRVRLRNEVPAVQVPQQDAPIRVEPVDPPPTARTPGGRMDSTDRSGSRSGRMGGPALNSVPSAAPPAEAPAN